MGSTRYDVVGLGNAIVDVLAHRDDAFLARHGLVKGAMTLIDEASANALDNELGDGVQCSGGSAANTMVGIASLGGTSAYIGKVRDDVLGQAFREDITAAGVTFETPAATAGPPSGRCVVIVTPDAQRTMQTFLGASAELGPDDVDERTIEAAGITYLEGYLWDPDPAKQAFLRAARIAHAAGRKVALSLSDSFCVVRHRAEFLELVEKHVDVLFANESEILALYETDDLDAALGSLRGCCEIAAVTRGPAGSVVLAGGETLRVEAEPVGKVVDTTGAGDLYASGFLCGLTRGRDPRTCARIGAIAAAEIIGHFGARPQADLAALVRQRLGSAV